MERSLKFADKFIVSDVCELTELHHACSLPQSHAVVLGIPLIEYPMSLAYMTEIAILV